MRLHQIFNVVLLFTVYMCAPVFLSSAQQFSGNPIIKHIRTADPSARIWADDSKTIWLYCSHDMDTATTYRSMDDYHVFSSTDMVNWKDHGSVLNSKDVKWGIPGHMWAPDCAYKNGTYYYYYPHKDSTKQWRIGVATGKRPEGPFTDIGRYIEGTHGIDPTCFIDDDGQAYLYFGKNYVAKLKDNMTELAEPAREIDYGATNSREGTYMHKRNGIYYYSYTDYTDTVYQAYYAMGKSPYGPFAYKGPLNPKPKTTAGAKFEAQDHHSIVEFKGTWYYFYHTGNYNEGNGKRRNICVDYLYYNPDGTMQVVKQTDKGVKKVGD
jgi:arabinoxylan arabinofuranohydrolase